MIARVAERATERVLDRLVEAAADELPSGVTAERADGGVRLSGRGLRRRWMIDPALRAFAILAMGRRA